MDAADFGAERGVDLAKQRQIVATRRAPDHVVVDLGALYR